MFELVHPPTERFIIGNETEFDKKYFIVNDLHRCDISVMEDITHEIETIQSDVLRKINSIHKEDLLEKLNPQP